jgi:hypothetical protein
MESSSATRKLAVEANAGCRRCRDSLHLHRPFQERRKPERILGIVPDRLDHKHPVILPVGKEGVFKISKDVMEIRIPDGDHKKRRCQVVAMKPIDHSEFSASDDTTTKSVPHKDYADKKRVGHPVMILLGQQPSKMVFMNNFVSSGQQTGRLEIKTSSESAWCEAVLEHGGKPCGS